MGSQFWTILKWVKLHKLHKIHKNILQLRHPKQPPRLRPHKNPPLPDLKTRQPRLLLLAYPPKTNNTNSNKKLSKNIINIFISTLKHYINKKIRSRFECYNKKIYLCFWIISLSMFYLNFNLIYLETFWKRLAYLEMFCRVFAKR